MIGFVEVGHDPKDLDHSITFEMHDPAFLADLDVLNSPVARIVRIDMTIGLQARQPAPVESAQAFEVGQTAVPTVKADIIGRETPLVGLLEHRPEVIVLVQTARGLVIDPTIDRKTGASIGPDQTGEVNPSYGRFVFAAPVPADQIDEAGMGFIERAVINDQ